MSDQKDFKELSDFLKSDRHPSRAVDDLLRTTIHDALNPSLFITFIKVFLLSSVGSFATLLLCPQFGVGFMGPIGVASHYFMQVHPNLCFFICGAVWMLPGQLLVNWILSLEELRLVRKYYVVGPVSVLGASLAFFGHQGSMSVESWVIAWLAGCIVVSVANAKGLHKKLQRLSALQASVLSN